jgi:hypothetical protein
MSASTLSSVATSDQDAERALLATLREIDHGFRIKIKARIEELTTQAGKHALEFLLQPEAHQAELSALGAKNRADAIADGLNRYISACRHYCDVNGAVNTIRGVAGTLEQLRDFQRGEAESSALKNLTGHNNEVADGRLRKMALSSYQRSEGTDEFIKLLRAAFESVLQYDAVSVHTC